MGIAIVLRSAAWIAAYDARCLPQRDAGDNRLLRMCEGEGQVFLK